MINASNVENIDFKYDDTLSIHIAVFLAIDLYVCDVIGVLARDHLVDVIIIWKLLPKWIKCLSNWT